MSATLVLNADSTPISILPLSVISWEVAIKAVFLETVSVIAEYEDWEVHSPSTVMHVPSVVMAKSFLHFKRNMAFSKETIFLRDRYACQYCHKVFPEHKLTMDHVLPRKYGGKTDWNNITTACGPCNLKKGSNKKMVPDKIPHKPSYYELVAARKEYPLAIPCEDWVDYLGWPEDKLFVKGRNILLEPLIA